MLVDSVHREISLGKDEIVLGYVIDVSWVISIFVENVVRRKRGIGFVCHDIYLLLRCGCGCGDVS